MTKLIRDSKTGDYYTTDKKYKNRERNSRLECQ